MQPQQQPQETRQISDIITTRDEYYRTNHHYETLDIFTEGMVIASLSIDSPVLF